MSEIFGSQVSSDGGLTSRFEIVRNAIMDKLASISIDNGYRNDVADVIRDIRIPSEIAEFPEIGVILGTRTIKGITSTKSLVDAECDVYVQAVVKANESTDKAPTDLIDATESIHHDVCKALHAAFISQINSSEPWNVLGGSFITDSFEIQGCGVVMATFKVHLRNMDGTFL
jgi:hypothetical protein